MLGGQSKVHIFPWHSHRAVTGHCIWFVLQFKAIFYQMSPVRTQLA